MRIWVSKMIGAKYRTTVDLITNLLTIAVALIFIGVMVQRFVFPAKSATMAPPPGTTITIEGFYPAEHHRNVVLVLIQGCRFCEASMGFYRDLNEQRRTQNFGIAAVFPSGTPDAESYLHRFNLQVPIAYSSLSAISVGATPTIIITDSRGTVLKTWVGELDEAGTDEVKKFLGAS